MSKIRTILPKLCIPVLLILTSTPVKAQITPDNTLGAERSVVTPNTLVQGKGINADLITGGAQRGRNLFHSFSDFNVNAGQSVYFANPSQVTNILTRVTGGNQSNILGTLGVDGTANLFLINPAGILFGKNATLDLKGSFVGTTANGVQFGNLGSFSATNPQAPPPLLTIDPSGLLFNQLNQQGITVTNQSVGASLANLQVPSGKSLLLVGGDVTLDGGRVAASGGRVELASLAAPGTIGLNVAGDTLSLSVPSDVQRGNVSLRNQASVSVSGAGGGDIAVNAGNLTMSNSSGLFAQIATGLGNGSSKAGDININADSVSLFNGSQISNSTFGRGDTGNITIIAKGAITFDGVNSGLFSTVEAGAVGNAGTININTGSLSLTNGAQIDSFTRGKGNGGDITVQANNALTFDGVANGYPSGLFSTVQAGAVGNAGNLTINTRDLLIQDGAQVSTATYGGGNAGNLTVNATDSVELKSKDGKGFLSELLATAERGATGTAGDLMIKTGKLLLEDGAQVSVGTWGPKKGGNLTVNATDSVQVIGYPTSLNSTNFETATGGAGNLTINTPNLLIQDSGQITSSTFGKGNAGYISIIAGNIFTKGGGEIISSTFGKGNAGNISITARDGIFLDGNNSGILSTVQAGAVGNAGTININTGSLSLTNGAQVGASTFGAGNAGSLTITANSVQVIGSTNNDANHSNLSTQSNRGAIGAAGDITINTRELLVGDGAYIGTTTFGAGKGGNLNINADTIELTGASANGQYPGGLFTQQNDIGATGEPGDLTINTRQLLVKNRALVAVPNYGTGNGGNLNITARFIQLNNGTLTGQTNSGNGGDITLTVADYILLRNGSVISTTAAKAGDGGKIIINTPFIVAIPSENSDIKANADIGSPGQININRPIRKFANDSKSGFGGG